KFYHTLVIIATQLKNDEVKRESHRTSSLEETPAEYLSRERDGDNPYDVTEQKELALILNQAIRRLRPEYAELITLRYEQDLTIEDIAEITGLAIGTIKSSLHRARKELADSLRRRGLSTTP